MPLKVYLEIRQVTSLLRGKYKFWGEVRPVPVPFSCILEFAPQLQGHVGKSTIELAAGTRYTSTLVLEIKTDQVAPSEVARAALPLEWFPADQVVEEWFPFKAIPKYPAGLMVLLRIHIAKRFSLPPFSAPPGRILVLPAWNRPGKPAIPPTPYFSPLPPGYERLTVGQGAYPGGGYPPTDARSKAKAEKAAKAKAGKAGNPPPAAAPPPGAAAPSYPPPPGAAPSYPPPPGAAPSYPPPPGAAPAYPPPRAAAPAYPPPGAAPAYPPARATAPAYPPPGAAPAYPPPPGPAPLYPPPPQEFAIDPDNPYARLPPADDGEPEYPSLSALA